MLLCHNKAGNEIDARALYNSGDVASELVKTAFEFLGIEYNIDTFTALASQISSRAMYDTSELLAECVADYMTNKEFANDLSIMLWGLVGGL